jgi:hypothetical protein
VARLKAEGVITGGMIPKLETACNAVSGGCGSAVIMDGRVQHCTLQHLVREAPEVRAPRTTDGHRVAYLLLGTSVGTVGRRRDRRVPV